MRHESARRAAPRARRAHGAVRRLGHAAAVHRRARGTPGVPGARRRVRRVAPRHDRVRRTRARSTLLQWLLTNDLRKIDAGPRAVHAPARSRRRARRRRHHRVVGRRRALLRDAERVEHRADPRRVRRRLAHADGEVAFADVTPTRAVLAVQGPEARALLAKVATGRGRGAALRGARRSASSWSRAPATPARTASSCTCRPRRPRRVWDALRRRRASTPAGLGARDTLRLEAGLPLHGHELGPGITPLQAGLGWVVGWDKGDFRGRGAAGGGAGAGRARAACAG